MMKSLKRKPKHSLSKLLAIFLISLITLNNAVAQSTVLDKDQKAPFRGVLLPEDLANQLKNDSLDKERYKLINESLEKSLSLSKSSLEVEEKKTDILSERNMKLSASLSSARDMTTWERIAWFGAGLLVTSLAVYATVQLTK